MKKLLLLIIMLVSLPCMAQYATFESMGKKYPIRAFVNKNGDITVDINLLSIDHIYKDVHFFVTEKRLNELYEILDNVAEKLAKWDSVCGEVGIKDVNKQIGWEWGDPTLAFSGQLADGDSFCYYSRIDNRGAVLMGFMPLTSLTNKHIKCEGATIIFESPYTIRKFKELLSIDRLKKYINEQAEIDNLLQ